MVNWRVISIAKQNRSPKRVDVAFRKCIEHVGTSLRLGGVQLAWATSVRQAIYLNNPELLLIGFCEQASSRVNVFGCGVHLLFSFWPKFIHSICRVLYNPCLMLLV